jgi:hypothetical protein
LALFPDFIFPAECGDYGLLLRFTILTCKKCAVTKVTVVGGGPPKLKNDGNMRVLAPLTKNDGTASEAGAPSYACLWRRVGQQNRYLRRKHRVILSPGAPPLRTGAEGPLQLRNASPSSVLIPSKTSPPKSSSPWAISTCHPDRRYAALAHRSRRTPTATKTQRQRFYPGRNLTPETPPT